MAMGGSSVAIMPGMGQVRQRPRKGGRQAARRMAESGASEYHGDDITKWLRSEEDRHHRLEMELRAKQGLDAADGHERLEPRWVLEFDARPPGDAAMTHMEECWLLCRRMWQVGLSITHQRGEGGKTLIITVGANTRKLREEAARIKIPMRMQDTMGMVPFAEQPAENALRALISSTLKLHRIDAARTREIKTDCESLGATELALKARELGCERVEVLEALHGGGLYVHTPNGTPFNSAQEQRLVMSLMNKGLLIPLEARRQLPTRTEFLEQFKVMLSIPKPVSAKFLAQMLTSFGAYTVDDRGSYVQAERIGPYCKKVAIVTEIDRDADGGGPWFIVKNPDTTDLTGIDAVEERLFKALGFGEKHSRVRQEKDLQRLQKLRLEAHCDQGESPRLNPVEWADLQGLRHELDVWVTGAGRQERFSKTLITFYPTHDHTELAFFQRRWATLNVVLNFRLRMRDNENKNTEGALYNPNSVVNFNPSRQPKQWMLWFQPVDEIRDYFGDEVGLYFAWLGIYTKSLAFSSIFGVLSMLYGMINTQSVDPDLNDLTLVYSVFVAVWSVIFLQSWTRREKELNFLWGTENLADSQEPRIEFVGRPKVVGFPGKETWVESGIIWPMMQKCMSWMLIILMMVATTVVGLIAEGLSSNRSEWWEKFDSDPPNGYIDQQELVQIGLALQNKHRSFLGEGQSVDLWAENLMYDDATGWLSPRRDEPVCSIMQGQCTRSDDPEEDNCDEWIEAGHCVTNFNTTLGINVDPNPKVVNFGAAWRASEYKSYKVVAPLYLPWLRENSWVVIAAFFNLFFLQLFAYIFKKIATKLNDWENHRLSSSHDRHLIIKLFAFAFINNYFVLFYIAYFRHMEILPDIRVKLPEFLGGESFQLQRPMKCDQSCMSDLQVKLFVVFTGKTYGMKVLELGVPLLRRCMRSSESSQANNAPGQQEAAQTRKSSTQKALESGVQLDSSRSEWKGVDQEFAQMVTQFGYLALFAPACSLAPLLAFINNVTEIRSDAWKLCNLFQRPIAKQVQSIGAWAEVLKTLALAAVIVNSTMVFFVGSQMACPHDETYVQNMMELRQSNLEQYEELESADRPTFAERQLDGLLCSSWSSPSSSARKSRYGDLLELDGVAYRVTVSRLWVLALILEHLVLLLRFSMGSFRPIFPQWLETARETLKFKKVLIENSSDRDKHEAIAVALKMVRRMGADHPEEVFDMMDLDSDGKLTAQEIGRCCKYMGMDIADEEELMDIVKLIDGDGDLLVDRQEFADWWAVNGGKNKFQLKDSKKMFAQYDKNGSGLLEATELVEVCRELGMHRLSDKQKEVLMQELDADGDNTVDVEEFDMWWTDNGGEKFRPRAPPGPGDMSRRRRFEFRKFESKRRKADKASFEVSKGMTQLNQLDDNEAPPAPARHAVATDGSAYTRVRPEQRQALKSTLEIEQPQSANVDLLEAEVHLNPLSRQSVDTSQAHATTRDQHKPNGHGWAALRTGQQQHALFDGQNDVPHIARRAAALLKPMPLKVDHTKMTRHQLQRAQHSAALDRRVEELLMGSGAKLTHQTRSVGGSGVQGVDTVAAAPVRPPRVAPRPLTAETSYRRSPPPAVSMVASLGPTPSAHTNEASSTLIGRRQAPTSSPSRWRAAGSVAQTTNGLGQAARVLGSQGRRTTHHNVQGSLGKF